MKIDAKNELKLSCTAEYPVTVYNEEKDLHILVSIKAPIMEEELKKEKEDNRAPIDMIAVIDRSGSMQGQKLELLKKTLEFMIKQFSDKDRLGIVDYGSDVTVTLPLMKMDVEGREMATKRVKGIKTSGCTNLSGGLFKALDMLHTRKEKNDIASVLLFTDGHANEGVTDAKSIERMMKGQQVIEPVSAYPDFSYQKAYQTNVQFSNIRRSKSRMPKVKPKVNVFEPLVPAPKIEKKEVNYAESITVNTFGFGANHSADFLKQIATAGNGLYYFMKDAEVIPDAFISCLGGLMSVVAQNVKVSLKSKAISIEKVYTNFGLKTIEEKKEYEISIRDIQAEEHRDFLVKLKVPATSKAIEMQELLEVMVVYDNVITKKESMKSKALAIIERSNEKPKEMKRVKVVEEQINRYATTEAMLEAMKLGNAGKFSEAKSVLKLAKNQILKSNAKEECNDYLQELEECDTLLAPKAYGSGGVQAMQSAWSSHAYQRNSSISKSSNARYMNSKRKAMKKSYYK